MCQEGKSVIKSSLMKEAHPTGEFSIAEKVNLLNVSSSFVAEYIPGSEVNDVVMSELNSLCVERGVEIDRPDLVDFKRAPSLYQVFLDRLHWYGFNGGLSNFSIKKVNPEAVGNFPFLDEFDGRMFSAFVLTARYVSRIKGINEDVANMFVLSLTREDGHLKPRLKVSAYLQLPESMSMLLTNEKRTNWKNAKNGFEGRKKIDRVCGIEEEIVRR